MTGAFQFHQHVGDLSWRVPSRPTGLKPSSLTSSLILSGYGSSLMLGSATSGPRGRTRARRRAVLAPWCMTCVGLPSGRSSAPACRDRSPCRSSVTRRSRSIGATPSWMKRCSGKPRHVSMPGWLPLRQHHRRPPSLLSVEVVDSGAASRGESGHPTPAGQGLMFSAALMRSIPSALPSRPYNPVTVWP